MDFEDKYGVLKINRSLDNKKEINKKNETLTPPASSLYIEDFYDYLSEIIWKTIIHE